MVLYKCIYCQQKFIYKGNYTLHNKNINKCKIKLEELIAKYKTYTNEKLLNDLNNLILDDDAKYKCKVCDKIYNSYNGLKRHKLMQCHKKEQMINIANPTNNTINNSTNNIITIPTNNQNLTEKYKKKTIPISLKRVVWEVCLR